MILPSVPLCKARNWQQHSEHSREALRQDVPYVAHVLNCNCRQARGKGKGSKGSKGSKEAKGEKEVPNWRVDLFACKSVCNSRPMINANRRKGGA